MSSVSNLAQSPLFPYKTLTQQEFDLYSGYWKIVVNSGDNWLPACFLNGQAAYVGYSATQIAMLVSTVGARSIEARFVCGVPTANLNPPLSNFGVVLYAADQNGNPLSSYYLSDASNQPLTPNNGDMPVAAGDGNGAVQIPHYLAASWMQNWGECCNPKTKGQDVTRDLFVTAAGTLAGYSFTVGDLLQSLFNAQPVKGVEFYMLFNFCLHEYYTLAAPGEAGYTFGLVIRLYNTDGTPTPKQPGTTLRLSQGALTAPGGGGDGGANEPFYDMSAPRPPY